MFRLICAAISAVLGASAFVITQAVSKEFFEPIQAACFSSDPETAVREAGLHPYIHNLGGGFVCLITQFLAHLVREPAGIFAWGVIAGLALPYTILSSIEAGRGGAKGVIRYPTFLGLLAQVFGVSVMFPLLWVPGALYGEGDGVPSQGRLRLVLSTSFVFPVLTLLMFTLDADTYGWTAVAGLIGGPILPLVNLMYWPLYPPEHADAAYKRTVSNLLAKAYGVSAAVAFVGYAINLYLLTTAHGYTPTALVSALWTEANVSVKFMTIDFLVLFMGFVVYFAADSLSDALGALAMSFVVGPGAAAGIILARREHGRMNVTAKCD